MAENVCFIRRAGVIEDGRAQLDLKATDNSFDWTWFISAPATGKEMLAIARAAISTDRQVIAVIQDPVASFAQVNRLFLVK